MGSSIFSYIEEIVEFFIEVETESIDIDLVHEVRYMYDKDDYTEATKEHKELLEDVYVTTLNTAKYQKQYVEVAEDLKDIIERM